MKKTLLLFAAAIAAASCTAEMDFEPVMPEKNTPEVSDTRTVHFNAIQTDTKAQFGTPVNGSYPTLWTSNDQKVKLSLNYDSAIEADVTPTSDFSNASFDAEISFSGVTGPYTFYSVSPSSAAYALSPSREAWKVRIPCEQTPSATSVDEAGIILAASSAAFVDAVDVQNVDLQFSHLTAYGRMSLSNLNLASGETVSAVELTVTTPIVGDLYWETSGTTITDYGASSTLTINTSSTSDIWFACAPVEVGGEIMYVRVYTSKGSYEQLVEFPSGRSFQAGRTAVFTVNMTGADFTAAGSGSGTTVSVSMNSFTDVSGYVNGDTNISYEATQGTAQNAPVVNSDEIRIYQNGGLLTVTANNGKTITNVTIGSSMGTTVQVKIDNGSFGSDNSITANGTYSTGTISASTVVFKCTGTTKTSRLYLNSLSVTYAESGSGSSGPDPLLAESAYGCYLGTGLNRELVQGVDQVNRSYSSSDVLTYAIINADSVEELEITGYKRSLLKGDSATITVNWRIGTHTVVSESYNMTLIKEEGPKVWMSDGTHGVIIKK